MRNSSRVFSTVLGLIGAVAGGVFGHMLFFWFVKYNFYAMVFPGAFLGMGCGLLSRHSSKLRGAVCGAAALLLGLHTEWTFRPFIDDDSFSYFLLHVGLLTPVAQIMIGLGAAIAYWFGKDAGFDLARAVLRRSQKPSA